ncbi:MAG TPA: ABC transporter permease [Symbiobacteriaceae bacterium]|nr:ABC transporter permease [Symbiobacteriaceae bacterium]
MAISEANIAIDAKDRSLTSRNSENQLRTICRRFFRNKAAVVGLGILLVLYLVAVFAPLLAPYPLDFLDVSLGKLPPGTSGHWLGTDHLGRDVLSRIIWGSRISLSVGFISMFMSVGIGAVWGAIAGYYGGTWVDIVMMRIAEAIELIPVYFLLITVVAVFRPSIINIMLIIGFTSWPGLANLVRGQFLSLRERDYTQASRALGAKDSRLIFRHILPNAAAPIIVSATLRIANGIMLESSLSFLGLGTQPPNVSWGQMVSLGRNYLRDIPWTAMYPGLAILITVLCFNFVGDGLRDALDPKMKR